MPPDWLRRVALILAVLTAGCGTDPPVAPTQTIPGTIETAVLSCPPSVERQSVAGLPVSIDWDLPTVAGIGVDKGSCSPVSGTAFPIGTSTVTCTPDQTTLASSCSFAITITPPDPVLRVTTFLAFGDSITAGVVGSSFLPYGMSAREFRGLLRASGRQSIPGILAAALQPLSSYPAQLQTLLAPTYSTQVIGVSNEGLPGERASQGVSRLAALLPSVRPDVLLLLEGFNDIDLAVAAQPAGDTSRIDVAPIAASLRSMVTTAQGLGIDVLLATLTPVDFPPEDTPGVPEAVVDLNAEIRRMAAELGLGGAVDLHAALEGVPGLIGADKLHPTVAGYRRMAELFFTEIVSRYEMTPQAQTFSAVR
jgi:lysophospholipase L1-like esterase